MILSGKRIGLLSLSVVLLGTLISTTLLGGQVWAGNITSESLTLQDGATAGGSQPSGVVNHLFSMTLPTAATIKSILFQYCTTPDGTCTVPHGLSTTSAVYGTHTGAAFDSVVNSGSAGQPGSNGEPYLTSSAGVAITANEAITEQMTGITNPDGTDCAGTNGNCTFYVRISTFATTNASGGTTDTGEVAAAVSQQIVLTGLMPESLIFCSGGTVGLNASNVPDCTTATSGSINFDGDFSPNSSTFATSEFAASTNASAGYVVTVGGATLTSGTNSIAAIGASPAVATSGIGTAQFGLNLVHDTTTDSLVPALSPLSANVNPAPDGTNTMGKATTNFSTDGSYAFNTSALNTIAKSDNGTGTAAPTNGQVFTVTYMVNVPGKQVAGTYKTTLTYICTATF